MLRTSMRRIACSTRSAAAAMEANSTVPASSATACTLPDTASLIGSSSKSSFTTLASKFTWMMKDGTNSLSPPLIRSFASTKDTNNDVQQGDEDDDDTASLLGAFDELISAAYQLVREGKPADAEYILREGAKQAEEALGEENAIIVSTLYDQLALIQFMHDRSEEAREPASKVYNILKGVLEAEPSDAAAGAAASAATRYAAVLLASGHREEAEPLLKVAVPMLDQAIHAVEGDANLTEKFLTALGEAQFYSTLCTLASYNLEDLSPAIVQQQTPKLSQGLATMQNNLGKQHPLIACALREHNRGLDAALDVDQLAAAEALLQQQIFLHSQCEHGSEYVAMMLYQLGTLQYVMGKNEAAKESLNKSLEYIQDFEAPDGEQQHMITVKHRLGLVLAEMLRFTEAKDILNSIADKLIELLGPDNPVTAELKHMMAYIEIQQSVAAGNLSSERRSELLEEMKKQLKALEEYGIEHMLVKKARKLHEHACTL